jgi:hypothetical protein
MKDNEGRVLYKSKRKNFYPLYYCITLIQVIQHDTVLIQQTRSPNTRHSPFKPLAL